MFDFFGNLFDSSGFVPRRACGNWTPELVFLHNFSDAAIWLAYLAIPLTLVYITRRRKDLPFKWMFWLFFAFIVSCGFTHFIEVVLFYNPVYRLSGAVKLATALASWATVLAFIPLVPRALTLRSAAELEREIRERKRAEEALRSSQERFRLLVEGVQDYAIFLLDLQGCVVTWNPGAEFTTGYKTDEVVGRHFSCFYPEDDRAGGKPDRCLETAVQQGRFEEEGWRVRKDGSRFWAKAVLAALRDEAGRLMGFSKITHDLTDRKRAEELRQQAHEDLEKRVQERTAELAHANQVLRASEERMRSVVDHVIDGIITMDEYGMVESFNPAAERIFGYRASEVVGRNVKVLMPEPYHGEHDGYLANYLRTGQAKIIGIGREVVGRRKDGSTFAMDLAVSAYSLGERRFFTGIVRDITDRKRAEEELRKAHDELEMKVEQRTVELTQVNGRLHQSLDEKEVLLKEIHHRVKNNLQVISSLLHLQSQFTRDAASVEMFRESQHRVRSMALVHERLYRSPDLMEVNFSAYIENLTTHLFRSYQVDADRIGIEMDVREVRLSIDTAVPCGLLINELVSNCLKHAFQGRDRGLIRIELLPVGVDTLLARSPIGEPKKTGEADDEILLQVGDDGVGLQPSIAPETAETFGMQLIVALVEQLHGRVSVDRKDGTTFRIVFPRTK